MPATAYPYTYTGGTFGSNVQPIPFPNPASDLSSVYPNLSGTNAAASSALLSKLQGQLSPATVNAMQDAAARFGVANGMPGSNAIPGTLANNSYLANIGQTSEQEQQQGLQDYSSLIPSVASTQTVNPALQTEINTQNAVSASAPNPSAAQSYAQQLFDRYLNTMNKGKGGAPSLSVRWPSAGATGPTPWYSPGNPVSSYSETLYPGGIQPLPTGNMTGFNGNQAPAIDPETGLPYSPGDYLGTPQGPDQGTGE